MSVIRTLRWWEWAAALIAMSLLVYWLATAAGAFAGSAAVTYTGYDGPVLVSADGRTITVGGFSGNCAGAVTLNVHESARQVELRLKWTTPNNRQLACSAALIVDLEARLDAPLGQRTLVDADTGHPLSWFDGREVLHPTRLPTGYQLQYTSPVAFGPAASGARAGCTQFFRARSGIGTFEIVQVPGSLDGIAPPLEREHSAVTVRGRSGEGDARSIRWSDGVESYYAGLDGADPSLTIADLIATADSAPQPPV